MSTTAKKLCGLISEIKTLGYNLIRSLHPMYLYIFLICGIEEGDCRTGTTIIIQL